MSAPPDDPKDRLLEMITGTHINHILAQRTLWGARMTIYAATGLAMVDLVRMILGVLT